MTPIEFIEQNGMEEAKFLLDEWDGVTTNWSLDTGFIYVDQSIDTHMLCMESLNELYKAMIGAYK